MARRNGSARLATMEARKSVGIIGAGISGLVTAKAFLSQGYAVTVIEKMPTLGGVWAPARRYPGLRIQISRDCYRLSDFPMPAHYPEFPSSEQMFAYLEAYAAQFSVARHIRFGSEVTAVAARPDGRDGWRLELRNVHTGEGS